MTIGVGFVCSDGIVLCADRQLTSAGGFKFEESKILTAQGENYEYTLALSYAGDPDDAKIMFRKMQEGFQDSLSEVKGKSTSDRARNILQQVYKNRNSRDLETLIAFIQRGSTGCLFKTRGTKVVDGHAEYIGAGDSSALRYLTNFLFDDHGSLNTNEAQILGSYIVSVANRFVDRCGGGPDSTVLCQNGVIIQTTCGPYPFLELRDHFELSEKLIGKKLRKLLLTGEDDMSSHGRHTD